MKNKKNRPKKIDDPILSGKQCPYCHQPTVYVDSAEIYGISYGMIYLCRSCRAYCGVHQGTNISLGRIANSDLRELKKLAHDYFDTLWKSKYISRHEAYVWLGSVLQISKERAHIGMLDEDQCRKLIGAAKEYRRKLVHKMTHP